MKRFTAVLMIISVLCGFFGLCGFNAEAADESLPDTSEISVIESSEDVFESDERHKPRGNPADVSGEKKSPQGTPLEASNEKKSPPKKPSQTSKTEAKLADYSTQNDNIRVMITIVLCIVSVVVII